MKRTMRTDETEARYMVAKANGSLVPLAQVPSNREWIHWRLIDNDFPHDRIAKTHHMLLPKRVFPDLLEMSVEEQMELILLMSTILADDYDSFKINTARQRSVPNHFHIHCLEYREDL